MAEKDPYQRILFCHLIYFMGWGGPFKFNNIQYLTKLMDLCTIKLRLIFSIVAEKRGNHFFGANQETFVGNHLSRARQLTSSVVDGSTYGL